MVFFVVRDDAVTTDGDDGDDGEEDDDDREGLPSMRWVGCGRATTTKRRAAGWRLRRCPRG